MSVDRQARLHAKLVAFAAYCERSWPGRMDEVIAAIERRASRVLRSDMLGGEEMLRGVELDIDQAVDACCRQAHAERVRETFHLVPK